jgi:alpha-tubulin suppressor-like RCC1 family protein
VLGYVSGAASGQSSSTPVSVTGISGAVAIGTGGWSVTGDTQACALLSGGTIKCWGGNGGGALGSGTRVRYSPTPVSVKGISTAKAVSTGGAGGCALLSGGTIKCWGYNAEGQLGNGGKPYIQFSSTPVSVKGISTAKAVSTGSRGSCALLAGGTIKCWGDNRYGELGNGKAGSYLYPDSFTPVAVKGL